MKTQTLLKVAGWMTINLALAIINFLTILMLLALNLTDLYKVLPLAFGAYSGYSIIRGMNFYGFYLALPAGVIAILVGFISTRYARILEDRKLSTVAITNIVLGIATAIMGCGLLIIAVFFLRY